MYELFFKKLTEKISLTQEDKEIIKFYLIPKKLRKKQYLLQEEDIWAAKAAARNNSYAFRIETGL